MKFWSEHEADEDDTVCQALEMWWNAHGERPVTVSQLRELRAVIGGAPLRFEDMLIGNTVEKNASLKSRSRRWRLKFGR